MGRLSELCYGSGGAIGRPIPDIPFDPFASPYWPAARGASDTPPPAAEPETTHAHTAIELEAAMAALERRLLEALAANRHSQKRAARHLGHRYHPFRNRVKKIGLIGA